MGSPFSFDACDFISVSRLSVVLINRLMAVGAYLPATRNKTLLNTKPADRRYIYY
jgi:hypothetical protein